MASSGIKLLLIAGARPNFMKIAPLLHELRGEGAHGATNGLSWRLVHTGQHYDHTMSRVFFEDFELPEPDYFLDAGSGSHAEQTARVMVGFEKVCLEEKPDVAVVVGDVNSTLACSITAKKLHIEVAHVEAGLRSGDMAMPEEINRIVTDAVSDHLFVSERSGIENLRKEGRDEDQIHFVGNIMIDTLHYSLRKLTGMRGGGLQGETVRRTGTNGGRCAVVTLHRPSNVDDKDRLTGILSALRRISEDMEVYFPVHPRTEKNIREFGLTFLIDSSRIRTMQPLSYLQFLALWKDASLVLTDSGGLQEETTALGIPCFTIRENTERPVTIEEGTNILVGTKGEKIVEEYEKFRAGSGKKGRTPELWDGRTAERIVRILAGGAAAGHVRGRPAGHEG